MNFLVVRERKLTDVERATLLSGIPSVRERLSSLITYDANDTRVLRQLVVRRDMIPPYPLMKHICELLPRETLQQILFYCSDKSRVFPNDIPPVASDLDKVGCLYGKVDCRTERLRVDFSPRHGMGRFYADKGHSWASVTSCLRKTLMRTHGYVDIDVVKCHPSLLAYLGQSNGCDVTNLTHYVSHADAVMQDIVDFWSADPAKPITKTQAKSLVTRILYGGGVQGWIEQLQTGTDKDGNQWGARTVQRANETLPFIDRLKQECAAIADNIFLNHEDLHAEFATGAEHADKMSLVSYVICTLEHHIVYYALRTLVEADVITGTRGSHDVIWAWDGFAVIPKPGVEVAELLQRVNDSVAVFGTELSALLHFTEKAILDTDVLPSVGREDDLWNSNEFRVYDGDEFIPKPKPLFDEICECSALPYEQWKVKYEEDWAGFRHAKVASSGLYVELRMDNHGNMQDYEFIKHHDLPQRHSNYNCIKDGKVVNGPDIWRRDPRMRMYDTAQVVPPPRVCPPTTLNLWKESRFFGKPCRGTAAAKKEKVDLYEDLMLASCGDDMTVFKWVKLYIAHMQQHAGRKPGYTIVFLGSEGTGKSIFLRTTAKMVGMNRSEITKAEAAFGQFNGIIAGCYFVVLDEIPDQWTQAQAADFKILVTDQYVTMNHKNQNQYTIETFHRVMCSTNSTRASVPSKRRALYCTSSIRHKKLGPGEFEKFGQIENDEFALHAIYEHYMQMDCPEILPPPPFSASDRDMKMSNDLELRFLRDHVLRTDHWEFRDQIFHPETFFITVHELLREFREWIVREGGCADDVYKGSTGPMDFIRNYTHKSWPRGTFEKTTVEDREGESIKRRHGYNIDKKLIRDNIEFI